MELHTMVYIDKEPYIYHYSHFDGIHHYVFKNGGIAGELLAANSVVEYDGTNGRRPG